MVPVRIVPPLQLQRFRIGDAPDVLPLLTVGLFGLPADKTRSDKQDHEGDDDEAYVHAGVHDEFARDGFEMLTC